MATARLTAQMNEMIAEAERMMEEVRKKIHKDSAWRSFGLTGTQSPDEPYVEGAPYSFWKWNMHGETMTWSYFLSIGKVTIKGSGRREPNSPTAEIRYEMYHDNGMTTAMASRIGWYKQPEQRYATFYKTIDWE